MRLGEKRPRVLLVAVALDRAAIELDPEAGALGELDGLIGFDPDRLFEKLIGSAFGFWSNSSTSPSGSMR